MDLNGKVAIVTGGAQGIGKAIVSRLARLGAHVVIADINLKKAEETVGELTEAGFDCTAVKADMSLKNDLETLVQQVADRFGYINILVNNAGISQQVDILELNEEDYDRVLRINLKGMVFLSQQVLPYMIKNRSGKIINIASLAGERGGLFAGIHYSVSKAGVIAATKCLALKGGRYNINVNCIAPGLIATELAEKLKFSTESIPMGRLGSAEEVADGVAFLASDMASYITGVTLDINGGILMR